MNIVQVPTALFGYPKGTHGRNGQKAIAIVDHIQQGHEAVTLGMMANPNGHMSASFTIDLQGVIRQHVRIEDAPWTNGIDFANKTYANYRSDLSIPWIKQAWDKRLSPNLFTVTIEHEGYSGAPMPEAQVRSTIDLHKMLVDELGIRVDHQHITGHFSIDNVNRHYCPGTAYPWVRLFQALDRTAPNPILARAGAGLRAYYLAHAGLFGPAFEQWYDPLGNEVLLTGATAKHPRGHYHVAHKGASWRITSTCSCHPPSLP